MPRDNEPGGEASAEAPQDAIPLSDAAAEAAAGGYVANLGAFMRHIFEPAKVEEAPTPVPQLGPSFRGACPVQLSGSLPLKDE